VKREKQVRAEREPATGEANTSNRWAKTRGGGLFKRKTTSKERDQDKKLAVALGGKQVSRSRDLQGERPTPAIGKGGKEPPGQKMVQASLVVSKPGKKTRLLGKRGRA